MIVESVVGVTTATEVSSADESRAPPLEPRAQAAMATANESTNADRRFTGA
jgi:hypothetical protein